MVRFTIRTSNFDKIAEKMARASPQATHAMAIQMAKDTEPFVPARTKSLANRTRVDDDTIIYPGPYAHFLYKGKLFIDPNTGSPFARYGATKVITGRDLQYSKAVHSQAQSHWYEASKALNRKKWVRVAGRVVSRYF